MTVKNNRAPLLSIIKLCASFHHHMWIQTGVTVRKRLSWVLTSVTLTFDLWPWPFAWTSLLSLVITPENFMMIRWWEHSQKGVTDRRTDGQTDRQTDWTIHRAAWSQLKIMLMGENIITLTHTSYLYRALWNHKEFKIYTFIENHNKMPGRMPNLSGCTCSVFQMAASTRHNGLPIVNMFSWMPQVSPFARCTDLSGSIWNKFVESVGNKPFKLCYQMFNGLINSLRPSDAYMHQ